jgi:hypothetical protein
MVKSIPVPKSSKGNSGGRIIGGTSKQPTTKTGARPTGEQAPAKASKAGD